MARHGDGEGAEGRGVGEGEEELPEGWARVPLGEFVEVHDSRRVPVNSAERENRKGPYPYYGANGQAGSIDDFLFDGDFALLAEDGGYFDEPMRGVAYRASGKFWVNNHAHIIKPKGEIDVGLLVHMLNAFDWMPYVTGTTRLKLTQGAMVKAPFALPPVAEQRRIVAKLEDLLARSRRAKEALDAIPPLLETLRRSILAAAFRGDLTADWREQHPDVEPAEKLLARIRVERRKKWEEAELARLKAKGKAPTDDRWKEKYREPEAVDASELPELPEGWGWGGLSELAEIQLGQQRAPMHADAEVVYPYVRAANITWRGLDLSDVKQMGFPDPDRYLLVPGDVLLSEASGSASEVGKPAIWRGEIPNCCYQKTLIRVRPQTRFATSEWLHLAFLADALLGRFAAMAPGVGILHLTADRMLDWPVPVAPYAEQRAIISKTTLALRHVDQLTSAYEEMGPAVARAEASLLSKAFRGELVPQDPNDEPAAAMLARLRAATTDAADRPSGVRRKRGKSSAA